MGATEMHTDYMGNVNPMSAPFNGDVVWMQYFIWMGKFDTKGEKKLLASFVSHFEGVSVSSVSWGFTSPGAVSGDKESARLKFTLHDIAGSLISDIMKLRKGNYWLYFQGPNSIGYPWSGSEAVYIPQKKECTIEFSATQGFTYTISAIPTITLAKGPFLATRSEFTLSGNLAGKGADFRKYLVIELQTRWNEYAKDMGKPNACIVIEPGIHTLFTNQVQNSIKNEKGLVDVIEPFKVSKGTSIADAIRDLFNTRFKKPNADVQGDAKGDVGKRATLEIIFKKWEGENLTVGVEFIDNKDEKTIASKIPICIGSDLTCVGQPFRAQLVNMDFGPLYEIMTANALEANKEGSGTQDKTLHIQGGNDGSVPESGTQIDNARNSQLTVTELEILPPNFKTASGNWGLLDTALNKQKSAKFTIDIEMPYSFGFTPEVHGGMLLDAVKDSTGSGIHYTQGVDLSFWWYTTPLCAVLMKQPGVSGDYRISKVMHTIGLNGNTTQITLSHLSMS